MKNQEIILFPENMPDVSVLRLPPWVPPKRLIDTIGQFDIYKSDPENRDDKTIQYAVRWNEEDRLRIDVYEEGYFSTYWDSTINLRQFLDTVNEFLSAYKAELAAKPEDLSRLGVFAPYRNPEFYEYTLPLQESDFEETELFKDGHMSDFSLRIDSPVADFSLDPQNKSIGCLSYYNSSLSTRVKRSLAHYITTTQTTIPENVVIQTLSFLPWKI